MTKCTQCHGEIDSAWPGPSGDVCQMCWERYCSEEWWIALGGAGPDYKPWECPHCGESLGEPVTVNSREFLGDEIHGGVVEREDQMCSVCHKETRLRECEYFSDAQIADMMEEFKAELRRQEKVV